MESIQKITTEFVKVVSKKKKDQIEEKRTRGEAVSREEAEIDKVVIDKAGGKIFTYGSYRLGVYGPGGNS